MRPLLILLASLLMTSPAQSQAAAVPAPDAAAPATPQRLLVHLTHGPEAPTRAALAFSVAKAALDDGHTVVLFLAGDAVQLLRDAVLNSLNGVGTGNLREFYNAIVAKGGRFYVSLGSSRARGVTEADLQGKPAEFAGPPQLVKLTMAFDRTLTY
jgi:predicted peroxiredoxin